MPQNVVDADTWTATVQCAADGDSVDGASQLLPAQDLTDRSRYLYNRTPAASGGAYQVPICPVDFLGPAGGAAARWHWADTLNGWYSDAGGTEEMLVPLPALIDTTFNSVTVYVDGDANGLGPHAALPGTMPRVTLYQLDGTTCTLANVGNQVDTSGGVAAYETPHTITLSVAAQTIDSTTQYAISIRGEAGANSIPNALVLAGASMNIVPA